VPKPFDATTKDLVERFAADWAALAGAPPGVLVECIDSDIATISGQADKVLLVHDAEPWLLNLEFQSSPDETLARRLHRDAAILHERHRRPVESLVLLLRRQADHPALTGRLAYGRPGGAPSAFHYGVDRLWERPADGLLGAGLGLLPLAGLCDDAQGRLPAIVAAMSRRLAGEPEERAGMLWVATYTLLGLLHDAAFVSALLRGVRSMRDSSTYQAIVEEGLRLGEERGRKEGREEGLQAGRLQEARELLLLVGAPRLGQAPTAVREAVARIDALDRLHALAGRIVSVESWAELLADA